MPNPRCRALHRALLLGALLGSLTPVAFGSQPTAPHKMILVSWDGAGDEVIDRLLEEDRLPNLARLRERGTSSAHLFGTLPSKTAPSHASIYTGCGPGVHGIAGNRTLRGQEPDKSTVLDISRGFSADSLRAEPLFATTARAGLKTVVLSATQYIPHDALGEGLDSPLYTSFSGFESEIARSRAYDHNALGPRLTSAEAEDAGWSGLPRHHGEVHEVELETEGLYALILDSAEDPAEGFDRLLIREGSKGQDATSSALLEALPASRQARGWSPLMRLHGQTRDGRETSGLTSLRLFELADDASSMLLYRRRAAGVLGHHSAAQLAAYTGVDSGGHDVPFPTYVRGDLGVPIPADPRGRAEERLLEIVARDLDLRIAGTRYVWERWGPDALFVYSPISDQAGHTWLGALDPNSGTYVRETADRIWPVYARIFVELDRWLGTLLELAGDDTVVALVSDHGMAGVSRLVHLPTVLEAAGLLAHRSDGSVDLEKTQILPAESDFFLRVNADSFAQGIVPPDEHQKVVHRAADALLGVHDELTGHRPIRRVFTRDQLEDFAALGPATGDLYLGFAPGYYPTRRDSRRTPGAPIYSTPFVIGQGSHGFWPGRRDMHAIFYLAGPGVAAGREAPAARQIDVAPTLSHLLRIPAPREACGRILAEALSAIPMRSTATLPASTASENP